MGESKEERIARRRVETRAAAVAAREDIAYLREVAARPVPSPAEIRRASAVLRRLLVDGGLGAIAACRTPKLRLMTPDNKEFYRVDDDAVMFWSSGGVNILGFPYRGLMATVPGRDPDLTGYDENRGILLPIENFMRQRVMALDKQWVTRGEVIDYVANAASGVHDGRADTPQRMLLARLRQTVHFALEGQSFAITMDMGAIQAGEEGFAYSPDRIDPVMVELLATMHFIANSADVQALEEFIDQNG